MNVQCTDFHCERIISFNSVHLDPRRDLYCFWDSFLFEGPTNSLLADATENLIFNSFLNQLHPSNAEQSWDVTFFFLM